MPLWHIFVSAMHNSSFAIHTKAKNQDFRCPITDVCVLGRSQNDGFGSEMGRRGSPRAHTLGKWSHGPQDPFKIPPGPPITFFLFGCVRFVYRCDIDVIPV